MGGGVEDTSVPTRDPLEVIFEQQQQSMTLLDEMYQAAFGYQRTDPSQNATLNPPVKNFPNFGTAFPS